MKLNIQVSSDMLLFVAAICLFVNGMLFKSGFIESVIHVFMWVMLAERLVSWAIKAKLQQGFFKKEKTVKGLNFEFVAECHDYAHKLSKKNLFQIAFAYIMLAVIVGSRLDWLWMCSALLVVGIGTLYDALNYDKEKSKPAV